MDVRSIIACKRDRGTLNAQALRDFAAGLASGAVSDAQAGAFAMAVLLNGMTEVERMALTLAMRDSGRVLRWNLSGPVVDKHSTGGVGDSVALMLAPALAATGVFVPMISGRGLGHTGGTLDKLASIPGYRTTVQEADLLDIVTQTGCAIVGASEAIAPADRRLYAIRDISATVESLDLITASILAKKLAAGLDALVLDVKCGSGAFMKDVQAADQLAQSLVQTARGSGMHAAALITSMDVPLAPVAGNALEVANAIAFLTGGHTEAENQRLLAVTMALGSELLLLCGQVADRVTAEERLDTALRSGQAAERFERMVAALGGPSDILQKADTYLPRAPVICPVTAERGAYVDSVDTEALGYVVVDLGGGRHRETDSIDPRVGLQWLALPGTKVTPQTPLALVHAANEAAADAAIAAVRAAVCLSEEPPSMEASPVRARL